MSLFISFKPVFPPQKRITKGKNLQCSDEGSIERVWVDFFETATDQASVKVKIYCQQIHWSRSRE